MYALVGSIAETVFTDCRIRIYNHAVAYFSTIINSNIRIYYTIITDLDISPNKHAGINYTTVFDSCPVCYCYKIMNMAVHTNFRAIGNRSLRADPNFVMLTMPMQEHHYLHKGIVRIISY